MREVIIHTAEPDSTKETTNIIVNIINITYKKFHLEEIASGTTQINDKEKSLLHSVT